MNLGGRLLRKYIAADIVAAWAPTKVVKGFRKLEMRSGDLPLAIIESEPIVMDNAHTVSRSSQTLVVNIRGRWAYPTGAHVDRLEDIAEEHAQLLVDRLLLSGARYGEHSEFYLPFVIQVDCGQDEDSADHFVQCTVSFGVQYEPDYTRTGGDV